MVYALKEPIPEQKPSASGNANSEQPVQAPVAQPTESPKPAAEAKLNRPQGTHVPVGHTLTDGALLYLPETNSFMALYPDEWLVCRNDADEHTSAIQAQQEANKRVTEKSKKYREILKAGTKAEIEAAEKELATAISDLEQANKKLKAKLKPLGDLKAKGSMKLVEAVPLYKTDKKFAPIYINSEKLKNALADKRIYMVNGNAEKAKRTPDKILKDGKLNTKEIKTRIAESAVDKAKFNKKWKLAPDGEDAYTGVLTDWAKVMNGDLHHFLERTVDSANTYFNIDPNDPHRMVDLSAEAQLMRYTAGAGLEVNFNPFKGNLEDGRDSTVLSRTKRAISQGQAGIHANAEASFSVAEGKVRSLWYIPHYAGWHANPTVLQQDFDLGWFRFMADLVLYGAVGASINVELDVKLLYTGNKQGIKGTPKGSKGAKAQTGASGELDAFAGAKAGIDLLGALQWLSPEGISDGRPRKVDPKKTEVAEYVNVAEIHPKVEGQAGASATASFKIDYKGGRFVIHAKAGACLGLGGKGDITFAVSAATIGEFFKCIAYQLKHANYEKMLQLLSADAYTAFARIATIIAATQIDIADLAEKELKELEAEVVNAIDDARRSGKDFLNAIQKKMKSWGIVAYLPPEAQGTLVYMAMETGRDNPEYRETGASVVASILELQQSERQKEELLQRLCPELDGKIDRSQGRTTLTAFLSGTDYANALAQADLRLSKIKDPVIGVPFMRNTEPAFMTAQLGIDHPVYRGDYGTIV